MNQYNKYQEKNKCDINENKKSVKKTLILFAILHIIFTVLVSSIIGNDAKHTNMAPIVIQYIIAWYIIKPQFCKKTKKDIVNYSWSVAICIFVIGLILGAILFPLIDILIYQIKS